MKYIDVIFRKLSKTNDYVKLYFLIDSKIHIDGITAIDVNKKKLDHP